MFVAKRKEKRISKHKKERQLIQDKLNEFLGKALWGFEGKAVDLANDSLDLILAQEYKEDTVLRVNSDHYALRFSEDLFLLEVESSLIQYYLVTTQMRLLDMDVEEATYKTTLDVYRNARFIKARWNKTLSNIGS